MRLGCENGQKFCVPFVLQTAQLGSGSFNWRWVDSGPRRGGRALATDAPLGSRRTFSGWEGLYGSMCMWKRTKVSPGAMLCCSFSDGLNCNSCNWYVRGKMQWVRCIVQTVQDIYTHVMYIHCALLHLCNAFLRHCVLSSICIRTLGHPSRP